MSSHVYLFYLLGWGESEKGNHQPFQIDELTDLIQCFISFYLIILFYFSVCRNGSLQFELITGYAYTTSTDLMRLIPGSLELTQCLAYCQINDTCKAINYETGLCVLLSTSALQRPEALKPSQFPVFTIYAQKICMPSKYIFCTST